MEAKFATSLNHEEFALSINIPSLYSDELTEECPPLPLHSSWWSLKNGN